MQDRAEARRQELAHTLLDVQRERVAVAESIMRLTAESDLSSMETLVLKLLRLRRSLGKLGYPKTAEQASRDQRAGKITGAAPKPPQAGVFEC